MAETSNLTRWGRANKKAVMPNSKKLSEKQAMQLALKEAERGAGFSLPNPPVGCVILGKDFKLLSCGHYECFGALHAEISALKKIKDKKKLKGAHLFVTLEPCSHFGQRPPCAEALAKLPLSSVTYGLEDPNPKVSGRGLKKLKEAGFKLKKTSFFQRPIWRMYEAFNLNMKEQKSFFALKSASSLDGVLALSSGESQWITGEKSRQAAQGLRAQFDAVLIGINTFLEDNPRLNCRLKGFNKIKNKICILDPAGRSIRLISQSQAAKVRPMKNIFIITKKTPKKKYPFRILEAPLRAGGSQFDLQKLSRRLYKENIRSVLVEGGAKTFSAFLEQKAAQRLYQFISPCLLGGGGKYWTEELPLNSLKDRLKLSSKELLFYGEDILITGAL